MDEFGEKTPRDNMSGREAAVRVCVLVMVECDFRGNFQKTEIENYP